MAFSFNPSPYSIGGNLNFGSTPSNYGQAYANALSLNQQNYANILQGYQNLGQSVLGDIQGIGASQSTAIEQQYKAEIGSQDQKLISRGLGNSTVTSAVERGLLKDKTNADVSLANQLAAQTAGYRSNIGMAQLGFMNSVNSPYPNIDAYNRLDQQRGMVAEARRNRNSLGYGAMGGYGGGTAMAMAPRSSGIGGIGYSSGAGGGGSGGGSYGYSAPYRPTGSAPAQTAYGYGDNWTDGGVETGVFDPQNYQEGGTYSGAFDEADPWTQVSPDPSEWE